MVTMLGQVWYVLGYSGCWQHCLYMYQEHGWIEFGASCLTVCSVLSCCVTLAAVDKHKLLLDTKCKVVAIAKTRDVLAQNGIICNV